MQEISPLKAGMLDYDMYSRHLKMSQLGCTSIFARDVGRQALEGIVALRAHAEAAEVEPVGRQGHGPLPISNHMLQYRDAEDVYTSGLSHLCPRRGHAGP